VDHVRRLVQDQRAGVGLPGPTVDLDPYRMLPDRVAEELEAAGLVVHARLVREPDEKEKVPQAYLMANRRRA